MVSIGTKTHGNLNLQKGKRANMLSIGVNAESANRCVGAATGVSDKTRKARQKDAFTMVRKTTKWYNAM